MKVSFIAVLFFSFLVAPLTLRGEEIPGPGRSAEDSLKCLEKLSISTLAIEKKMYDRAVKSWWFLFRECPDISVRLYADGVKLFEHYIDEASDDHEKDAFVDTLMMVYDKRIQYFGHHDKYPEGWILGRKGRDILKYRNGEGGALEEAFDCFQQSYALMKENTEISVMLAWLQTSGELYKQGDLSDDRYFEDMFTVYAHFSDEDITSRYDASLNERIQKAVNGMIKKSDINDCALLEKVIRKRDITSLNPGEVDLYIELLELTACKSRQLHASLLEQLFKQSPSSEVACDLARMFIPEGRYNKSVNYYDEAIEITNNDSLKAVYYYELAVLIDGHFDEPVRARQYAKRASALLPKWGKPHLLIGGIYARASSDISGNELEKKAVYWASVDQFMTAMQKDSSLKEEALAQIETYSQYFPDPQTCFFHGLEEGQSFVVGDWVNEPTKVRFN
ncbi:MAG: hypothetical protein R6U46_12180 [Marinilabilia sp.]